MKNLVRVCFGLRLFVSFIWNCFDYAISIKNIFLIQLTLLIGLITCNLCKLQGKKLVLC